MIEQVYDELPKGETHEKKTRVRFDHMDADKITESISSYYGPVAWCNTCGGKHPRRACNLVPVLRIAKKSGNVVTRYTRPELIDER